MALRVLLVFRARQGLVLAENGPGGSRHVTIRNPHPLRAVLAWSDTCWRAPLTEIRPETAGGDPFSAPCSPISLGGRVEKVKWDSLGRGFNPVLWYFSDEWTSGLT